MRTLITNSRFRQALTGMLLLATTGFTSDNGEHVPILKGPGVSQIVAGRALPGDPTPLRDPHGSPAEEATMPAFLPGDRLKGQFDLLTEIHVASFQAYPGLNFRLRLGSSTPEMATRVSIFSADRTEIESWKFQGKSLGKWKKVLLKGGGQYLLVVENISQVTGAYRIRTKVKHSKKAGTIKMKLKEQSVVPFKALPGATCKLVVKSNEHCSRPGQVSLTSPSGTNISLPNTAMESGNIVISDIPLDEVGFYEVAVAGFFQLPKAAVKVKIVLEQPETGQVIRMGDSPILAGDGRLRDWLGRANHLSG